MGARLWRFAAGQRKARSSLYFPDAPLQNPARFNFAETPSGPLYE